MSDSFEDMRRKELEVQEKQLFAQRVTAAASVANAVAAHKQAAAVEEMREQMAVNATREAEHQREMAAQQRQMAEDQRLTNFRNTVLTTLPLLKSEEEKTQFLTEQLLPKLKENVDVKIYGPFELICLWFTAESQMVTAYLKNEAGLDLNEFLSNGDKVTSMVGECLAELEQRKKQAQELAKLQPILNEIEKPFSKRKSAPAEFIMFSIVLLASLFAIGSIGDKSFFGEGKNSENPYFETGAFILIALVIFIYVKIHVRFRKEKIRSLKAKILGLTPSDDGYALANEFSELRKKTELQKEKWEGYKPQIVEYILKRFSQYINCDARSFLVEHVVALQLESGLQEVQSFLPPSSRLPAKHFAEFFISESDVRKCTENHLNIKKQLDLAIEPFYKNKTVVLLLERVRPDQAPKPSDSGLRTVRLTAMPADKKIPVIKALREVKTGLGLMGAMKLCISVPVVILDSVPTQEAQRAVAILEAAGAKVELS